MNPCVFERRIPRVRVSFVSSMFLNERKQNSSSSKSANEARPRHRGENFLEGPEVKI